MYIKSHKYLACTTSVMVMSSIGLPNGVVKGVLCPILMFVGASMTAGLPDIDNDESRAARKIPILKILKSRKGLAMAVVLLAAAIGCLFKAHMTGDFLGVSESEWLMVCVAFAGMAGIRVLARVLFGHRKLAHSLFLAMPVCIVLSSALFALESMLGMQDMAAWMVWGMQIGILSHLFYDCFTAMGASLLYPLVKKKFSFGNLISGKDDWKMDIIATAVMAVIVLSQHKGFAMDALAFFGVMA